MLNTEKNKLFLNKVLQNMKIPELWFLKVKKKDKSTRDNSISPDSKLNCLKGITQLLYYFRRGEATTPFKELLTFINRRG